MTIDNGLDAIEQLLRESADDLRDAIAYPPTPPIAASVRAELQRRRSRSPRLRLAWAVALAVVAFLALLLLSPDVREAVARFFGLETVRIERVATLPAPPGPPPMTTPASTGQSTTPQPIDLFGLTTLDEARARTRFEIGLPDPGQPAYVYFQDLEFAQQVILVYPDFTIYEAEGAIYRKVIAGSTLVEEVQVGDRPALWLTGGEHLVQLQSPAGAPRIDYRRVEGNVLAWEVGDVTYRIETALPLAEALRIAESIR